MPELNRPFKAWISVTVEDTLGIQIMAENIVLDRLRTSWKQGERFNHHILIPNIPPDAKHMKVYFWNIDRVPIKLGAVEITLSEIVEDSWNSSNLQ